MKDYTMKYMKLDVLILADFFQNFRETSLKYYEIDPCYCYSAPGLAWSSGLKYSGIRLKYFKEEKMSLTIQRMICYYFLRKAQEVELHQFMEIEE